MIEVLKLVPPVALNFIGIEFAEAQKFSVAMTLVSVSGIYMYIIGYQAFGK